MMPATWKQCNFCEHKENGPRRMQYHQEAAHPMEFSQLTAKLKLDAVLADAANDAQYIADYEDYQTALLLDLPVAARELIEDRLSKWPYGTKRDGTPYIDQLRWAVTEYHPKQIALAQQALDEIERAAS